MSDEAVGQRLRAAGHRVTPQRLAVHDVLASASGHLTADQVAARSDAPNVGTVYRALALFEQLGIARSVRLGDDATTSWELAHPDDHVHLVCTSCDRVDHHVGNAVDQLRHHLDDDHGFAVDEVDLVVSGVCARCRGLADEVLPPDLPAAVDDQPAAMDQVTEAVDQATGAGHG